MAGRYTLHVNSPMLSNVVVTGGTFNQHNTYNNRGLDLLQGATAASAFHNSGERYDPPRCHPNTRVAVMKTIVDWMLGLEKKHQGKFIMWLTGAAGAGKSAILQSFAEQQDLEGRLLASFFFGKSDADRNHIRKLVATIAYQIHAKIPDVRHHMVLAIEEDPLVFTRSLLTQFMTLIIQPLRDALLLESRFFNQPHAPRLIVIDGLDECIDRREQKEILMTISKITQEYQLPIKFLISSRPEHDITALFSSSHFQTTCSRVNLDEGFSPRNDIELYLRHEFSDIKTNHPFRRFLPPLWPSDSDVADLASKSSGQFIYAATVVKYVGSTRHRPDHRLEVVLSIRPLTQPRQNPFAELDALYTHIFSKVDDVDISVVLRVLSFIPGNSRYNPTVEQIELILALEYGQISVSFCDLGALIITNESNGPGSHKIRILHASLQDFLGDPERSQSFYIRLEYVYENLISCVRFLSGNEYHRSVSVITDSISSYITSKFFAIKNTHTKFTASLVQELRKFSIPRHFESLHRDVVFGAFNFSYLPAILSFLKQCDLEDAKRLYTHHLSLFREAFLSRLTELDMYNSRTSYDACFALHLALAFHYPNSPSHLRHSKLRNHPLVPLASLMPDFRLFDPEYYVERHVALHSFRAGRSLLDTETRQNLSQYFEYTDSLSHLCPFDRLDKLESDVDPGLAKSWRIFSKEVYAGAARCSLEYLCNTTSADLFVSPHQRRFNAYISGMIHDSPWKWRRSFGSRGSCRARKHYLLVRPLKYWLQSLFTLLSESIIMRKTKSKPIYFHTFSSLDFDSNDPIVLERVHSEKYLLALGYLVFFLPMAGKSEALLQLCRTKAFSRRCCEYPKRTKEARRAIEDYLARMEIEQDEE